MQLQILQRLRMVLEQLERVVGLAGENDADDLVEDEAKSVLRKAFVLRHFSAEEHRRIQNVNNGLWIGDNALVTWIMYVFNIDTFECIVNALSCVLLVLDCLVLLILAAWLRRAERLLQVLEDGVDVFNFVALK